jgi:Holliday junction DNA helicase RuvB
MREEGLLSGTLRPEEAAFEAGLRPRRMEEFVGQEELKERLAILIEAARSRSEPVDHLLFSGPPGLGKTTMAAIVANEMGAQFRATAGPALERPGDLAAILSNLERGDVMFIDEVHRLPRVVEEVLYSAMEDFQLDIVVGKGPAARSIRLDLPGFTLIGATTRVGLLGHPFRDRFGIIARLNLYSADELVAIAERSAGILKIPITPEGAEEIARRSRGTPRIVNRLLRRVRDYALVRGGGGEITREVASRALSLLGIDQLGLDELDRRILSVIVDDFRGGPVGLKTIAIAIGEDVRTVEEVYEPYLIRIGFLKRTPQGRETTPEAAAHLHRSWW